MYQIMKHHIEDHDDFYFPKRLNFIFCMYDVPFTPSLIAWRRVVASSS